jgi:hypothetical protein
MPRPSSRLGPCWSWPASAGTAPLRTPSRTPGSSSAGVALQGTQHPGGRISHDLPLDVGQLCCAILHDPGDPRQVMDHPWREPLARRQERIRLVCVVGKQASAGRAPRGRRCHAGSMVRAELPVHLVPAGPAARPQPNPQAGRAFIRSEPGRGLRGLEALPAGGLTDLVGAVPLRVRLAVPSALARASTAWTKSPKRGLDPVQHDAPS